ncbi:carbohydrate esterase family 4 protein [Serendipita vermifera MAFF 305830]|uniref:Carbohydrate esterase family 4 protein n=1 Tax=Serendipita vermifera MAFF 305830 TaxID=933852 RepID=A0A0C2WV30_SERVB|nr:carbohydrate esterase family 4 protein [Serendipita vermifera MAFF 305830]
MKISSASVLSCLALFASAQATTVGGILKHSGIVIQECAIPRTAALTFDDGPNDYEVSLNFTLKPSFHLGTFFVCGNLYHCIYYYADSLRHVFLEGHQIASHTWTHPDLTTLSDAQIHEEMKKTEDALEAILGVVPAYMRPPYGAVNANVSAVAKARGQDVVIWNFDSQDWNSLTPAESKARYDAQVATNSSTVLALNHETYNGTATEVLPYAIKLLKSHGYKLVTVAECMGSYPYQRVHLPARNISSYTCT